MRLPLLRTSAVIGLSRPLRLRALGAGEGDSRGLGICLADGDGSGLGMCRPDGVSSGLGMCLAEGGTNRLGICRVFGVCCSASGCGWRAAVAGDCWPCCSVSACHGAKGRCC